ncbi:MAG: hypothetical protein JO153_09015 [Solirubrobacterales bacterium]|nr:hypothetical protein [Solirubrobacterales bacterium]MBV9916628.1 hypothetical protein [Solirubrobacterales bacterium]
MRDTKSAAGTNQLQELVYELIDAHDDTARLAGELADEDVGWNAHLDYLRRLQRVAREVLAQSAAG